MRRDFLPVNRTVPASRICSYPSLELLYCPITATIVVPAAPNLVPSGSSLTTTTLDNSTLVLRCLVSAWQRLHHYECQAIRNGQNVTECEKSEVSFSEKLARWELFFFSLGLWLCREVAAAGDDCA